MINKAVKEKAITIEIEVEVETLEVKGDMKKIKTRINSGTWGKPFWYGKLKITK